MVHKIHLFKLNQVVACTEEQNILEATLAAGIEHTNACRGQGKCSTCRVSIISGIENCTDRTEDETLIANKLKLPRDIRLACQTKVKGDIGIRRMVTDQLDLDIVKKQFSDNSQIVIGSQQMLTIVFTDIENYTTLAEKFPAYDVVHVLGRYYKIMNDVIVKNLGIISDVAGDGILSVFGVDKDCENSVLDAINSVREMNEMLELFNDYLQKNFNIQFGIRAGIHYGSVIVGPFDTGSMKKIAVIGDPVNYASRIESANKEFGTRQLLSQEAYEKVKKHYPDHRVYTTSLKGKTGEYNLIELL